MNSARQDDLPYPQEHVILTDCTGPKNQQSEMAYYYDVPSPPANPDTFTEITTPEEGLQHWQGRSTTGTFAGSVTAGDTVVTVRLNNTAADGQPIGTARNSWGTDFVCFDMSGSSGEVLYAREGRKCIGVFDCNHADRVATSPIQFAAAETATSSTSSSTEPASSSSSPPPKANNSVLAIALGVSLGIVTLIIIGVFAYWKYWHRRRLDETSKSFSFENSDDTGIKPPDGNDDKARIVPLDGTPLYEVNGSLRPTELTGSRPLVHELEGIPDRQMREY